VTVGAGWGYQCQPLPQPALLGERMSREVSEIESIYCVCKETRGGVTMIDGWDCSCDVLFKGEEEEREYFKHVAVIKVPRLEAV